MYSIPSAAIRNGGFYILQRCTNDVNGIWKDEYVGKLSEVVVDHLLPSTVYQFRILIKSADEVSISKPTDCTVYISLFIYLFIDCLYIISNTRSSNVIYTWWWS